MVDLNPSWEPKERPRSIGQGNSLGSVLKGLESRADQGNVAPPSGTNTYRCQRRVSSCDLIRHPEQILAVSVSSQSVPSGSYLRMLAVALRYARGDPFIRSGLRWRPTRDWEVSDSGHHRRVLPQDEKTKQNYRLCSGRAGIRSRNCYPGAGVTLSLGTVVGHYTVIEHVADGTIAEVYRGRDERQDRVVALKLLPEMSEQSRREAVTVAALDHPNIVSTFDVIEYNGRLCLVQEWIEGHTLADELGPAGQLGVTETIRLGHDVACALSYAHREGILHRDIKPSNVLRTAAGTYKLVDFGAFGRVQAETGTTRAGEIAGTPLYMSPEQITGAPQSPASDLFGLGLLLYRCLHGCLPDSWAGSYLQLAYSRTQTPISVPPSILQGLLERCLALDPAQRPHSAAEVLTELNRIQWQATAIPTQAVPLPIDPTDANSAKKHPDPSGWAPTPRLPYGTTPVPAPPSKQWARDGTLSPSARTSTRWPGLVVLFVAGLGIVFVAELGIALFGFWYGLIRVSVGLAIAGVGLVVAHQIRRRWTSRSPDTERKAATILFGAGQRDELTRSLMIEVDEVVKNLDSFDAKFLGITVVAMIREYEQARKSSDRQAALLNVVTLMEKLQVCLSPWHVRHKDAIATGIAVVGALAGVASVVSGFLGR